MKPEKLILCGWGPYKNRTEIDFTQMYADGLFLICGPTGAGKTTIFDALTYALYGALSGEVREKNSVRSDFAAVDEETYVELTMTHAGKRYEIRRNPEYDRPVKRGKKDALTREKEKALLTLPDGNRVDGPKEVTQKVNEILRLDEKQFKQITMIAQGEFARLLTASPREKMAIFRDLFGTGSFEKFTSALRTRADALARRVKEEEKKRRENAENLVRSADDDEAFAALKNELQEAYPNFEKVEAFLGECEQALKRKLDGIEKKTGELTQTNEKLTALVSEKKAQNELFDRLALLEKEKAALAERETEMNGVREALRLAERAQGLMPDYLRFGQAKERQRKASENLQLVIRQKNALSQEYELLQILESEKEAFYRYTEDAGQIHALQRKRQEAEKKAEKSRESYERAAEGYLEAKKDYTAKRSAYEEAEDAYRDAAVGIAAKMLKPGSPCPVCGSMEHPKPADTVESENFEENYRQRKMACERAQNLLTQKQNLAEHDKVQAESDAEAVTQLLKQEKELLANLQGAEKKYFSLPLFKSQEFLSGDYAKKAQFIRQKTERLHSVAGLLEGVREQEKRALLEAEGAQKDLTGAKADFTSRCQKEGFAGEEAFLKARLSEQEKKEKEEQLEAFQGRRAQLEGATAQLKGSLAGKERTELAGLLEQQEEIKKSLQEITKRTRHTQEILVLTKHGREYDKKCHAAISSAKEEYGYVDDLAKLAGGNNAMRLVFEQYVLFGYFERILQVANRRFLKMTGGRYEMFRVEEAADGRTKDSLDIEVMDYYSGKRRSIKTLSGGERFKASLALALGLSDVVQAANGGIVVETLFIDEGFGALDKESLEQACEALMGLLEHNKLIGIISHVAELAERIDRQIIVDRQSSGSSIRMR